MACRTSPVIWNKKNIIGFRLDDVESGSTDHSDFGDTELLDIEADFNRARKEWKLPKFVPKYLMMKQI